MNDKQTLRLFVNGVDLKGGRDMNGARHKPYAQVTFGDADGKAYTYVLNPGERLDTIYDAWENGDDLDVVAKVAPEYQWAARELLAVDRLEFVKNA